MLQPASRLNQTALKIMAGSVELKVVSKICYLGSVLSTSSNIDDDVNARLGQANAAFGRLRKRLWGNHGITLATSLRSRAHRFTVVPRFV